MCFDTPIAYMEYWMNFLYVIDINEHLQLSFYVCVSLLHWFDCLAYFLKLLLTYNMMSFQFHI